MALWFLQFWVFEKNQNPRIGAYGYFKNLKNHWVSWNNQKKTDSFLSDQLIFFTFASSELGVGMKKNLFSRADQGVFEILASADYIPIYLV
jgi:hypothetical protein